SFVDQIGAEDLSGAQSDVLGSNKAESIAIRNDIRNDAVFIGDGVSAEDAGGRAGDPVDAHGAVIDVLLQHGVPVYETIGADIGKGHSQDRGSCYRIDSVPRDYVTLEWLANARDHVGRIVRLQG